MAKMSEQNSNETLTEGVLKDPRVEVLEDNFPDIRKGGYWYIDLKLMWLRHEGAKAPVKFQSGITHQRS